MYDEIIRTENTITVIDYISTTPKKVFTRVATIPAGFKVWNIPEIAGDVVPLCQAIHPNDKNCFDVNTETLKYIVIEPEKAAKLRKCCGGDLKGCKRLAKRKNKYIRENALAALPVFEELEKMEG